MYTYTINIVRSGTVSYNVALIEYCTAKTYSYNTFGSLLYSLYRYKKTNY